MTFGEKLKRLMDEREVTQKEVSSCLNIAATTLNGYANDYREPDFKTLSALAKYFNVTTDYLLGISNDFYPTTNFDEEKLQLLINYYFRLSPKTRNLLLDEAKLLVKYDTQFH